MGISRQRASLLKHFYCPLCIDRNPELVTEFDTKAEREAVEMKAQGERKTMVMQKEGKKSKNKKHSRRCVLVCVIL